MAIGDPFGPPLFPEPTAVYIAGSNVPWYLNPYTGRYTKSRSYARRMQSGFRRGLTQSEARGYRGVRESQRRRERTIQQTGVTPSQFFAIGFEQRYGFTYNYWRYLKRNWIDEINARSSVSVQITPRWISIELANTQATGHDEAWLEARLYEKLTDMIAFQDDGDAYPGRVDYARRDTYAIALLTTPDYNPIEWWWYH